MERIFRATTPIKYPSYSNQIHSSGFFYGTLRKTYLITCKHCLFELREDGTYKFRPDDISIKIRYKYDHTKTESKRIDLYEDGDPRWIEPYNYNVDIAAIPLEFEVRDSGNTSFGGGGGMGIVADFTKHGRSGPGETAIVAGYPIIDTDTYAPILRNAMISSPMEIDQEEHTSFLIDAKLHDGTSGSPVLVKLEHEKTGRMHYSLVGVHSGEYDLIEKGSENLNRVWFISHIRNRLNEITNEQSEWW